MEMINNKIFVEVGMTYRHITLGTRVKVTEVTDNYVAYRKIATSKEFIKPKYVFRQVYRYE